MLAYYQSLRDKNGLTHEDAMRDSIVSVLMSPEFCYRIDLLDAVQRRLATRADAGQAAASNRLLPTARELRTLRRRSSRCPVTRWPAG